MNEDQRMTYIRELAESVTAQVIEGLQNSVRCCPTCTFWQDAQETCRNEINCPQGPQRPPANIIAFGCKLYIPGIPV